MLELLRHIGIIAFIFGGLNLPLYSQSLFNPLEIEGPSCVGLDSNSGNPFSLAPEISNYNVVITDGIAHIQLTQLFINPVEGLKDLVYIFPLPHEGSVHAMAMEHKGLLYKAEIYEKEKAIAIYDSVVSNGGTASLLLQHQPNIFQQRLANIPKEDTATVEIRISMPLKYESGTYELAIPTMIGARYDAEISQGSITSSADLWNPPEDREGPSLYINVIMQTGYPIEQIESPLHPINISNVSEEREYFEEIKMVLEDEKFEMDNNYAITLQKLKTYPNRDFVLRFSRSGSGQDFSLASYFEPDKKHGYFALNLFPDQLMVSTQRPDLEIVFLVDVSGSQNGWPLEKSVEVVSEMVNRLNPSDKFSVASFSGGTNWAFEPYTTVDATASNLSEAQSFLGNLSGGGGTELLSAVNNILQIPYDNEHQRLFVLTTDGFIGNVDGVLEAIKSHPSQPTIFTFGAGNNLNRYLLDKAAEIGGAQSFELTQSDNALEAVDIAWTKFETPQLKNIEVEFSGTTPSELIFPRGKNLFISSPLPVYGQYTKGGNINITVKGYNLGQPVEMTKELPLAADNNLNKAIPKIWAREKITELELDEGTSNNNKQQIIAISKEYQVLSEYTAFLAVNPETVDPDDSLVDRFSQVDVASEMVKPWSFAASWVNGSLTVNFSKPSSLIEWSVYDVRGNLIFSSHQKMENLKSLRWDGVLANGSQIAKGRYIIKITTLAGEFSRSFMVF